MNTSKEVWNHDRPDPSAQRPPFTTGNHATPEALHAALAEDWAKSARDMPASHALAAKRGVSKSTVHALCRVMLKA